MLAKLDHAILRLTMKGAHWVDYHFHRDNYILASWAYKTAAYAQVGSALEVLSHGGPLPLKILIGIVSPLIFIGMLADARRMVRASNKIARNPSQIPTEAYGQILLPGWARLIGLFIGLWLFVITILTDGPTLYGAVDSLCWAWNAYCAIAVYLAAIPPSSRKRKEKKSIDWSFGMTLQPIRTGA